MSTRYHAIPLIVYVPEGEYQSQDDAAAAILEHLAVVDCVYPLLAEDFEIGQVDIDLAEAEPSGRLTDSCRKVEVP